MTLQELQYVVEVAKTGSISQAASKLFVSPQAISKAVKNLEDQLKEDLFIRTPKGVVLSSFGQDFMADAVTVLNSANKLETDYSKDKRSEKKSTTLRLALESLTSFCYPVFLLSSEFVKRKPGYEIKTTSMLINDSTPITSGNYDAMFVSKRPGIPDENECDIYTVYSFPTIAVAHKDNPLCGRSNLTWVSFKNEPIFVRSSEIYFAQRIISKCLDNNFFPNLPFRGGSIFDPINFVLNNDGIAFVPKFIYDHFSRIPEVNKDLKILDFDPQIYAEYVLAVRKKTRKEIVNEYITFIAQNSHLINPLICKKENLSEDPEV